MEVPLYSHTLLSVYILHTPAAAVQLNLLTGRKTTKAPLAEYMLNTPCVFVCDWFCSVNTLDSMPPFYYYLLKTVLSKNMSARRDPGVLQRPPPIPHTPPPSVCVCSHASMRAEAACACHGATSLDALMLDWVCRHIKPPHPFPFPGSDADAERRTTVLDPTSFIPPGGPSIRLPILSRLKAPDLRLPGVLQRRD